MGASPPAGARQKAPSEDESSVAEANKRTGTASNNSPRSTIPISFSIQSQAQLDTSATDRNLDNGSPGPSYGVQSLNDTEKDAGAPHIPVEDTESAVEERLDADGDIPYNRSELEPRDSVTSDAAQPSSDRPLFGPALLKKLQTTIDRPFLPPSGIESVPISTPRSSSIRSLRLSDDDASVDDTASQAVASSPEDDAPGATRNEDGTQPADRGVEEAPQFIMPSLHIPSRRPFTERGKHVGKLHILFAGKKGSGKTSLIKSVVQTCEDIVHVEPADPKNVHKLRTSTRAHRNAREISNDSILEILASTKAYPSWMTDVEKHRPLKRSNSLPNDTVLERNISFIDTPGFDDPTSYEQHSASILDYIALHLHRNASLASISDSELMQVLDGHGGFQVDLVIYLLHGSLIETTDLDLVRRLSELTNVLPVISKTDSLDQEQLQSTRATIVGQLREVPVKFVDIQQVIREGQQSASEEHILCVSSSPARDDETLDASLLMSSEYMQPLQPSDLQCLTHALFDPDTAAYLRHTALKKFLQWRTKHHTRPSSRAASKRQNSPLVATFPDIHRHLQKQSTLSSVAIESQLGDPIAPSAILVSRRQSSDKAHMTSQMSARGSSPSSFNPSYVPNAYTVANVPDNTQREERLAQVRLTQWAADLQRALRKERARFAALKDEERAAWLRERLGECIDAEANNEDNEEVSMIRKHSPYSDQFPRTPLHSGDPLGLLEWRAKLSDRGLLVAKVVGSAGLVGAVVVWIMRTWGWGMDLIPEAPSSRGSTGFGNWWSFRDW